MGDGRPSFRVVTYNVQVTDNNWREARCKAFPKVLWWRQNARDWKEGAHVFHFQEAHNSDRNKQVKHLTACCTNPWSTRGKLKYECHDWIWGYEEDPVWGNDDIFSLTALMKTQSATGWQFEKSKGGKVLRHEFKNKNGAYNRPSRAHVIKVNGKKILLVNAHLQWNTGSKQWYRQCREDAAKELIRGHIPSFLKYFGMGGQCGSGRNVILTGDMNGDHHEEWWGIVTGEGGFKDVQHKDHFITRAGTTKDFIFYQGNDLELRDEPRGVKRKIGDRDVGFYAENDSKNEVSDHTGVFARFYVN